MKKMADVFGTKPCWNSNKCGEITILLSLGKEEFFLNCEFCDYSSLDLRKFINHICRNHILNFTQLSSRQKYTEQKNPLENIVLEELQKNPFEEIEGNSSDLKDFGKVEIQLNFEEMERQESQKNPIEEIDDKSSILKEFEKVEIQLNSEEMVSTLGMKEEDIFSEENGKFKVTANVQVPIGNLLDMSVGNSKVTPILVHESKTEECQKRLKGMTTNKKEFIIELIQVYKSLPALWDINHRDNKNKKLRQKQYDILLRKYKENHPNAKKDEVVRMINILRSTYRRNLKRNYPNGVSTLFYFDAMDFLRKFYVSQITTDDFSETECSKDTERYMKIQKGCEAVSGSDISGDEVKPFKCKDITIKEEQCELIPEQRFTLELIALYRTLPALWDKKSNDYKDREAKTIQYKILLEKYKEMYPDAIKVDLKRTINNLRSNYRRELKRPYSTNLYYFKALSFAYNNSLRSSEYVEHNYQNGEDKIDEKEWLESDSDVEFVDEEKKFCQRSVPDNCDAKNFLCNTHPESETINKCVEMKKNYNNSVALIPQTHPTHIDEEMQNYEKYANQNNLSGLHDIETPNLSRNLKEELKRRKTKFFPPKSILNETQCLMLVDMYKEFPSLWDETDMTYRFFNRRQEAFDKMCEKFNEKSGLNLTQENLKKEISRLRKICANEKKQQLLCKRENSDFTPTSKLFDHIAYLIANVHPFECTLCGKIYQTSDKCKIHMSTHDGSPPFKCHMCERGFQSASNLTVHLRRHVQDYTYNCDVCNKQCATSTDLYAHMRCHTNEKQYVCEICGKEYRSLSQFNTHMHCHDAEPQFKCEICNRTFNKNILKRIHVKAVHLNIRDKICTICNKAFKSTKNLRQHTHLHAAEKKYICKLCGKRFAQYAGLSGHVKSHGTTLSEIASKNIDLPKEDDSV